MTPIFKNYILKFRAWPGFSMKKGHRQAPKSVFMILSATAVKLHLTRKSEVSLQWRSKSWKLAWEPVEIGVWRCFWAYWRISVSKMGSSVQNYWKNIQTSKIGKKYQKIGSKKIGHFFDRKKVVFRGFRLRLPPHFRVFPSGWRGQTMGMRGSGDRIEPIYFQHKIIDFFFVFFGG